MRRKWSIESIQLKYEPIAAREFQQRLEEVLELLLNRNCQFKNNVFSIDKAILNPRISPDELTKVVSEKEAAEKRTGTHG